MLLSSSHRALHVNLFIFLPKILADFCPMCLCATPYPQSETLEVYPSTRRSKSSVPSTALHPNHKTGLQSMELPQHHPNLKKRILLSIKSQVCHCRGSRQTPQRVTGFMLSLILMMQCFINWSFPEQHV